MTEPVFVISTGRSGSTALSNCINSHPNLLSLSEFFLFIHFHTDFQEDESHWPGLSLERWDGQQFWDFISKKSPTHMHRYFDKGIMPKELLYKVTPTSRFNMETGIPGISMTPLPHLTDHPDELYEELESVVTQYPKDRLDRQYRRLFDYLLKRFGRDVCVERSGMSVYFVDRLINMFPNAKFIFLYRDLRENVMAFNRFQGFKMGMAIKEANKKTGVNPADPDTDPSQLGEYKWLHPHYFDVEKLNQFEIPYETFGSKLSQAMVSASGELDKLPSQQVLNLRYETLVDAPKDQLRRVIDFIQPESATKEANEQWVEQAAATIRSKPDTWQELPNEKRQRLEEACEPALKLLEYV